MYSGPHLSGRVGTTERACAVEAARPCTNRFSNAYAYTDSFTDSFTHSDANPQTDSHSFSHAHAFRRNLRRPMERHADLSWRGCSQRQQQQLHRSIFQPKPEPDVAREQRTSRQRRSLGSPCSLQRRQSYTYTHAEPNANSKAVSYSYSYAHTHALA